MNRGIRGIRSIWGEMRTPYFSETLYFSIEMYTLDYFSVATEYKLV